MSAGIIMRQAHYPGRAPIDAYGNGGFRFADMSHRGSILCLPSGIYGWTAIGGDVLGPGDFDRIVEEAGAIDIVLVGTGARLWPLSAPLRELMRGGNMVAESMSTGAAVRTYNVLLAEDRAVAAALIAVD